MKLLPNAFELQSLRREGRNWNHSNKKIQLYKLQLLITICEDLFFNVETFEFNKKF